MLTLDLIIAVCVGYVIVLFGVAYWAEERARRGQFGWLRSPLVYTLSISVYCTAWTYYGAVGSAARNGLEFAAIYVGPTLVFIGWWFILRKLVRIAREQRTTSIADLLSSRYGKSTRIGVIVTVMLVIATTPYIALQLQSLTVSFKVFLPPEEAALEFGDVTAFWIAAGLAVFAILFGTRNVDVNERHYGVVTAIALEAVIKLVALTSVGLYVVFWLSDGPGDVFSNLAQPALLSEDIFGARWATLVFLSATAVICLPRMFQVTVVENVDESHLATAGWAFPLYVFVISLFVLPIAIAGMTLLPEGSNPDLFVLTVPLTQGQNGLTLLAFLGGFSAATSMVVVSTIALSTMVSNHIVIPIWLAIARHDTRSSGDIRRVLLLARRMSIAVILALGYIYYRLTGGTGSLASIGLIAFCGAAQLLPSVIAGIYWQGATRTGAILAVSSGFAVWAYTLFLPSFEGAFLLNAALIEAGPFGIEALRPQALFGEDFSDPLVHALFWSMTVNIGALIAGSLFSRPRALETLQAGVFTDVFKRTADRPGMALQRTAKSEDLFELAQRILGREEAHEMFTEAARAQGKPYGLPDADPTLTQRLERELAGVIGAAAAHAMVTQISGYGAVTVGTLMRMADETAQIMEYTHRLEEKSNELEETAEQLRRANVQLKAIGVQKDAFLSQVSHELRTPMTSIRSFAEILREGADIPPEKSKRFISIIHDESQRLTRLLDEILDISVLEGGQITLRREDVTLDAVLTHAIAATEPLLTAHNVTLTRPKQAPDVVEADFDRLAQVFINVISNAVKYGRGDPARIDISTGGSRHVLEIDISDNGPGISPVDRERVFEKFARLGETTLAGGAGLGLPISREIMRNLGGELSVTGKGPGATFRISLPRRGSPALSSDQDAHPLHS
ncbi:Na+/proline symporter/nitrogen-specific signal transduction histidine kinase [Rubricella aquisinus]|uniref:histidine kinase n=1 Tax=Rubricella aquisinus TaxID=2028108 RepID=A0A840WNG9_9RHOB|nr:ATP-binding protein [Rubricella aquisinus]MBB5515202.1 Na+/proline symporter/nitrogen-specific signal transduction histidine kinase [Rubricella aquisinus]